MSKNFEIKIGKVRENRNFIGIELDPKYYKIAKSKIENEQSQLTLF